VAQVIREKARYRLRLSLRDDGVYSVEADDTVVFTSRVRSAAEIEFDEAVEARSQAARDARAREQADFAVRGVLAKAAQAKSTARSAGRERGKGG
jgi:hypothetical protein